MASSFFRTEFAGSFLANKRLKIDNDKSFMEKLPGDLSICVSEFLVSIKPYDINPRHKYDESNLRKIKESKSDILTDLASLIIVSKRSRLYYSDLMKLLKLPIKTVQISPAAIMRFKIPCIPMIGLRINEFISIDDNTFLFDTETFSVLSKKNVNIVIDDRPDREIDDDEFSHMLLYPNLSLKDFKELVSQKSGRAIFG